MKRGRRFLSTLLSGLTALVLASPAAAVIRVDFPVSKMYEDSVAVVVGAVVRADVNSRVVDVKVREVLKGKAGGDRLRIQVLKPAGLVKEVAAAQPVVLFAGGADEKPMAIIHLADTWLLAQGIRNAKPPAWRVVQIYNATRRFPGRTAGLARLVRDLRAGKPGIHDVIYAESFRGGARKLGNLKVRPTFLTAIHANRDKKPDLLVGTAGGVRLFLATPKGYADVTGAWGLAGAAASHAALGDVNGDKKLDLLLGRSLWVRAGNKYVRAKGALHLPAESGWLAVALSDVTSDQRPDAVVLLKTGELLTFQNPGAPDKPWPKSSRTLWKDAEAPGAAAFSNDWGDDGELHVLVVHKKDITRYAVGPKAGRPAGFQQLTGMPLAGCEGTKTTPFKVVMAAAFDYDGNGRRDFLMVTETGGLMLANRGFGAFLIDSQTPAKLRSGRGSKLPFKLTPATAVAPWRCRGPEGPRESLLVLTEDGRLFEIGNTE